MSYENRLGSLIDRELERALRFKKASDALKQSNALKDTLANRKELESIIQNGINDEKLMPFAKDSLMRYSKNNPDDHRYAKQLGFDLKSAEDLNSEKTKTRINLENSLNKISNLDPLVQTNSDSLKVMTDAVNQWQDRASELGMNQLLTTSNTRENQLLDGIKQQNNIIESLNNFRQFNGDLDDKQLAIGDLNNAILNLKTRNYEGAIDDISKANLKQSGGGFRVPTGQIIDNKQQMGTRISVNEAFKKDYDKDGKVIGYSKDKDGNRIPVSDNIIFNAPGYAGLPVRLDTRSYTGGYKEEDKGEISDTYLAAYKGDEAPAGIHPFTDDQTGNTGYFAAKVDKDGKMVTDKDGKPVQGNRINVDRIAEITMQGRNEARVAAEQAEQDKFDLMSGQSDIDTAGNVMLTNWEANPLNPDNPRRSKEKSKRFTDNNSTNFLKEQKWMKKTNWKSAGSIQTMQDELLTYVADHIDQYIDNDDLDAIYKTEKNRVKGAESVFRSKKFQDIIDSNDPNQALNDAFDFIGVEILPWKEDPAAIGQAELLKDVYALWLEMQTQKMRIKGQGKSGTAPGL